MLLISHDLEIVRDNKQSARLAFTMSIVLLEHMRKCKREFINIIAK